jgi:hypothetical protein
LSSNRPKSSITDLTDLVWKNFGSIKSTKEINVSLENCNINDVEEILAKLPQGILLNRSGTSLMDKIYKEFYKTQQPKKGRPSKAKA